MSDQQVIQDIDRVRARIDRLRGRIGKHWSEVEALPLQTASQAWNSLGQVARGFRSGDGSGKKHWLLGLLAAGTAKYLSQPGAVGRLWRLIYPYIRAWKQKPGQRTAPSSDE